MKKYITGILILLTACADDEKKPPVEDPSKIIVEAKVLTYEELPDTIRHRANTGYINGYAPGGGEKIEKENGFYLRLTLRNDLVARASCDTNALKQPGLMNVENRHLIYGKYRNALELFKDTTEIRVESKHSHILIDILRVGGIDTTYWGPLEKKPDSLRFYCWELDEKVTPAMRLR